MTSDLVQNKSKTLALTYSALLLTEYQDWIKSSSLSQTKNKKISSVKKNSLFHVLFSLLYILMFSHLFINLEDALFQSDLHIITTSLLSFF